MFESLKCVHNREHPQPNVTHAVYKPEGCGSLEEVDIMFVSNPNRTVIYAFPLIGSRESMYQSKHIHTRILRA